MKDNCLLFSIGISLFYMIDLLAIPIAHADISHYDMKGIHELLVPQFEHLSPIYGFTLLATRTLENRRFYGNYGEKVPGFNCMEHASETHLQLEENKDCPQDHTSELIQRLFPSQDGANFVANQISFDPISDLNPETIGQILGQISLVEDDGFQDPNQVQHLKGKLTDILFQRIKSKGAKKYKISYSHTLTQVRETVRNCSNPEERKTILSQLEALESVVLKLEDPQTHSHSTDDLERKQTSVTKKELEVPAKKLAESLANIIVQSLKEERVDKKYSGHLTEQALMAFFLRKSNEKKDFLDLMGGMSKVNSKIFKNSSQFKDAKWKGAFIANRWHESDFEERNVTGDPKAVAQNLLKDPEKLAFYVKQGDSVSKPLPTDFSYGQAKYQDTTYSDCGETSLRKFFNIVLYKRGGRGQGSRFDGSLLDHLKEKYPDVNLHPLLKPFYEKNNDPALAVNARDEWSHVVSGQEGITYNTKTKQSPDAPSCNLSSKSDGQFGFANMMKLIDRLIFHGSPDKSPIAKAQSEEGKITELCKLFSREGFQLEAKLVPNSNPNIRDIEFTINDSPSFHWSFNPGHFVLSHVDSKLLNWKNQMSEEMAKILAQTTKTKMTHDLLLLDWVTSSADRNKLIATLSGKRTAEEIEGVFYSFPLSDNDQKLAVFKQIVSSPREQALKMKHFAKRLQGKVPQDDPRTQEQIYQALADAGLPYDGDEVHPIRKPHVVYTRVSEAQLRNQFGEIVAKKMGRSWTREMYGYQIAIGEPLVNENGKVRKLTFEDAKKACLELNPPEKRYEITKAFLARETELQKLRDKYKYHLRKDKPDNIPREEQEAFDSIFKTKSIPGCYLPSREEWKILGADFGGQESKYIPQILPKLRHIFWSSSDHPYISNEAFRFSGYDGGVSAAHRLDEERVRCGCVAKAMDNKPGP